MRHTTYRILSCDGGGIRGVITAKLLQALDPSVIKNIDLFAGTSTGSIIALGLASYLPLAQQDRLGRAFAAGEQALIATSEAPADSDLGDRLRELGPVLLFPQYRSDGLRELLATYIPDITLADVWTERNKGIVTPSFQLSAVVPSGARQWAARLLNNLPNVAWMSGTKAIDAILASAAAPVFFPPHELPLTSGGNAFVDGGIFANNPSTAALAALLGSRLTAERNIPLSGVYLLSVGTGFRASSYPPPDALFPYGVLGWLRPRQDDGAPAFPLIDTVFDGTSQINDVTSGLILGADNHIRVNPQLDQTFSMDDCSAIPAMLAATERFMETDTWRLQSARINKLFGSAGSSPLSN